MNSWNFIEPLLDKDGYHFSINPNSLVSHFHRSMPAKIFFLHSGNESFVKLDLNLLQNSFVVHDYYARRKFPMDMLNLCRAVNNAEVVYCWFASWNSFWGLILAKILRKPSILVIGGYDIASLPEANYGHQRGGLGKWVSRCAIKLATVVFTNSEYSKKEAELNAGVPQDRVQVIYHGVPDPYGQLPILPRKQIALTVGKVDRPNLKRKGLEPFVRAAANLPDVQFILVGEWSDNSIEYLRSIASENVLFTGRLSDNELVAQYHQASVYVQASLHEGFGLSVAEAMLAGCIPVTTRAGALPEVVGECGFYCDSPDPAEIARVVKLALTASMTMREHARKRITEHFSMQKRGQLLEGLIRSVWKTQAP